MVLDTKPLTRPNYYEGLRITIEPEGPRQRAINSLLGRPATRRLILGFERLGVHEDCRTSLRRRFEACWGCSGTDCRDHDRIPRITLHLAAEVITDSLKEVVRKMAAEQVGRCLRGDCGKYPLIEDAVPRLRWLPF